MAESWVHVGSVQAVNPARREVRLRMAQGHAAQLNASKWLRLIQCDEAVFRGKVESIKADGQSIRVFLAPGVPRDTIAGLKGASVVVAASECARQWGGMTDVAALLEFTVHERDNTRLGRIVDAYMTPAHGVVDIAQADGTLMSLPIVEEAIANIDIENRMVMVNDIERFAVKQDGMQCGARDED